MGKSQQQQVSSGARTIPAPLETQALNFKELTFGELKFPVSGFSLFVKRFSYPRVFATGIPHQQIHGKTTMSLVVELSLCYTGVRRVGGLNGK